MQWNAISWLVETVNKLHQEALFTKHLCRHKTNYEEYRNISNLLMKIDLTWRFIWYQRLWQHSSSSLPMFSCQYHRRLRSLWSFSERHDEQNCFVFNQISSSKWSYWCCNSPVPRCQGPGIWSRPARYCSPPKVGSGVINVFYKF